MLFVAGLIVGIVATNVALALVVGMCQAAGRMDRRQGLDGLKDLEARCKPRVVGKDW
jgi:hypothetical protein